MKKILMLLRTLYASKTRSAPFAHFLITEDEVQGENGWREIHFGADVHCDASTPFEESGSECVVYDEPFSSGQTDPDLTRVRNDFVIVRFRRKTF
jgi:hypothetical protein